MSYTILVTNDDGINASGLQVAEQIAQEIAGKNGKVVTVAPAENQSGVSHAISYLRPSKISKHNDFRYSVEGSPADCILAGIYYVMKDFKPDLILSGVNNGHNVSEDILYSGTVGGAMEGALQGIKSIAMSQCYSKESLLLEDSFEVARNVGADICLKLIALNKWSAEPYKTFYNINFPAVKVSDLNGVTVCRQGKRPEIPFTMESHLSSDKELFLKVKHTPSNILNKDKATNTQDFEKIKENYITITPLTGDMTNYGELKDLKISL